MPSRSWGPLVRPAMYNAPSSRVSGCAEKLLLYTRTCTPRSSSFRILMTEYVPPQSKRERDVIGAVRKTEADSAGRWKLKSLELRCQAGDSRQKRLIRNRGISLNNRGLFGPTSG